MYVFKEIVFIFVGVVESFSFREARFRIFMCLPVLQMWKRQS